MKKKLELIGERGSLEAESERKKEEKKCNKDPQPARQREKEKENERNKEKKMEKKEIYKGRNTHSPSPTALEYKNTNKKDFLD